MPTYPKDAHESGGEYGKRSDVSERYAPTYRTGTYDHHGQYDRANSNPEYRTPTEARDTYEPSWNYPSKDHEQHISDYPNYGYSQNASGSNDAPPPTFRSSADEDAEYERQLQEATRLSQEEYIRKLEEERYYTERLLYDSYSRGRNSNKAGPSRTHRASSDSDED